MRIENRRQQTESKKVRLRFSRTLFLFCLLYSVFFTSCSVPNLEERECADARDALRVFYSFHLDNGINFNQEKLKLRQKFLTPDLFQMLTQKPDSATDYFTGSDEQPKSFRIGGCRIIEQDKKLSQDVVFFWRDDAKEESRQKIVRVETVNTSNNWLINKVETE
jgi:hypothetical protein